MSSTNLPARALGLAGLLVALSLPHTAQAQSLSPERALLNRVPPAAFTGVQAPVAQPPVPAAIDGERALLNRSQTLNQPVASATPVIADAPVDGVKALLNRSSS